MRKPKPSQTQDEILYVLANEGKITGDWITHRFSLCDRLGYFLSVPKRTMEVLVRNNWIARNKNKKKSMSMSDEYLITEEGRAAIR